MNSSSLSASSILRAGPCSQIRRNDDLGSLQTAGRARMYRVLGRGGMGICMSHFRSKKLLRSAENQSCVNCGASDGTIVSCHIRSVEFGSGTGIKAPDYFTVHLCHDCHSYMDGRDGRLSSDDKLIMWNRCFMKTVARWFDQEIVVVK